MVINSLFLHSYMYIYLFFHLVRGKRIRNDNVSPPQSNQDSVSFHGCVKRGMAHLEKDDP